MNPSNKIIDSHQHFWKLSRGDYTWLTPELTSLYEDYMPDEFEDILLKNNIQGTIVVQAADNSNETDFLLELANKYKFILGVVGWVDMLDPEVRYKLEYYKSHQKFVGIRPMLQDIIDDDWMLKPKLTTAYNSLIDLKLCFDALVKPQHLNNLLKLIELYPDLKIILNHCGKPDIKSNKYKDWPVKINELAKHDKIYCKLSGLVTEAGSNDNFEDLIPYIDCVFNSFGTNKVIWGSDWPVINLVGDYNTWLNNCLNYTKLFLEADRHKIFYKNAIDCYSLCLEGN